MVKCSDTHRKPDPLKYRDGQKKKYKATRQDI